MEILEAASLDKRATTAERNILATMDVNLDEMRQDRAAGLSHAVQSEGSMVYRRAPCSGVSFLE